MSTCGWCHRKNLKRDANGDLEEHTAPTISEVVICQGYDTWVRLSFDGGVPAIRDRSGSTKRRQLVGAR